MRVSSTLLLDNAVAIVVLLAWLIYMIAANQWALFATRWPVTLVMMAGGFIAGSTPMGGGVIAYPVMVLGLKRTPNEFRTFSLMMQSIGMTSASWKIVRSFKDHLRPLLLTSCICLSFFGYNIGYYLVQLSGNIVQTVYFTKMFILTVLLQIYITYVHPPERSLSLDLTLRQLPYIVPVTLIGGIATSMTGTGSDIWVYLFYRLMYNTEEILTTNHTVIIMSATSIFAFYNGWIIQRDISEKLWQDWICAIPSVLIMAPVGAWVANRWFKQSLWWQMYIYLLESSQMVVGFALTISKAWETIAICLSMLGASGLGFVGRYIWVDRKRILERQQQTSKDEKPLISEA